MPCPGHNDGKPCEGEIPLFRTAAGYSAVGTCTMERQRRMAARLDACFEHTEPATQALVAKKLRLTPGRFAAGEDPRGRVNAQAFDALLSMPVRHGVWLASVPGSGKTFLGWHTLARLVREHDLRCLYVTEAMIRAAWRAYERSSGEDRSAARLLGALGYPTPDRMVDAVFLDEFGSVRDLTDAALDFVDHLVNTLHMGGRRIIVGSNTTGGRLIAARGERVLSRLRELCGQPIGLEGTWRLEVVR